MCQEDIVNYLKKRGKPADMQDLLIHIPANRASISRNCRKLREARDIKYKKKKIKSYEKFVYFM